MKKLLYILAGLTIPFASCEKRDTPSLLPTESAVEHLNANLQTGTWRIAQYTDNGDNETIDFAGYAFDFSANGNVRAESPESTRFGFYNISDDNVKDLGYADVRLHLAFDGPGEFDDLNEGWLIRKHSPNRIEMYDESRGFGVNDILVLERI